jgi:putative transposase
MDFGGGSIHLGFNPLNAGTKHKRRPGVYGGRPSIVIDNTLDRQFDVAALDKAWVTDITYIRNNEGFAYLARDKCCAFALR